MRLRLISHGVEARKTKAALHNGVLALALEVGHIQNFRHRCPVCAPLCPALRSADCRAYGVEAWRWLGLPQCSFLS
ncbi:hypothetical protein E4U23_000017 [Claviceps purpurea]|nr:hypothetical protein E4U23_000017 [Claviceps purpurea]